MQRIVLTASLALVAALSLSACGKKDGPADVSPPAATPMPAPAPMGTPKPTPEVPSSTTPAPGGGAATDPAGKPK